MYAKSLRSRWIWLILAGLAASLSAPATSNARPPRVITFDQADAWGGWTFNNGPEFSGAAGSVEWDATHGRGGGGGVALHFSFVQGGNYVQAGYPLPDKNDIRSVRLWLRKPDQQRLTFRGIDAGDQTFQKNLEYPGGNWQQVQVDLSAWQHHFGGANDGKVRFPLKQFAVLVENNTSLKEGVVYIDDLELLGADAAGSERETAGYDAADDGAWHATGGAGNQYRDRVWEYSFASTPTPALGAHFSLLGDPRKLRLVLDSRSAGPRVSIRLGSHFQSFERELGTLSGAGEQVLEVPLDDMSGWSHSGGENDGQRRLPLRVEALKISRGNGPATGSITIRRLEVQTAFAPEHAVVLIPSVRGEGDSAEFSVTVRNLRPQEARGTLVCDVNELGGRIARQPIEMTLPGGARPVSKTISRPAGTSCFVEAVFRWIEPGHTSEAASVGTGAVPDDVVSPGLQPESVIGAGLYLQRFHGRPNALELIEREAVLAERAGIKWSREEILWGVTEPREGQFNWAFYDDMIAIALRHGISIYGLLDYWSPYAKANTEEGVEQYCRWAREVVRRYKDRIHHWEIWNEPNIFFWSGPRELYAKLLTRAYETIKAEDPGSTVMGCSTAGIDLDFIKKVMGWGGKFDALTIHPYRGTLDDLGYIRELQDVKALVGGRPVWITEIGFPSELVSGRSERRQASLVARVYLASVASGTISSVSWYDFRNDGTDPFHNEDNFGMVRSDFSPKPAYSALAALGRTLAGAKVQGGVDVGEGAYAFRFNARDRDILVACAPRVGRVLTYTCDQPLRVSNGVGDGVQPSGTNARRTITLDAGFPVYLAGLKGFTFKAVESVVRVSPTAPAGRPGETLRLVIAGDRAEKWELPFGWPEPKPGPEGAWELAIPTDAPSGTIEVAVTTGSSIRLPITLSIRPALLRI